MIGGLFQKLQKRQMVDGVPPVPMNPIQGNGMLLVYPTMNRASW
jgi:hypothetical protein